MPRGPRGERRPADAIGCAVMVAKIATQEVEGDVQTPSGKVWSGHAGAKARAAKLTSEQRHNIAKAAAAARWR